VKTKSTLGALKLLIEHAKDCSKPMVYHKNFMKKAQALIAAKAKKNHQVLTPVAFEGA
jgi:non-homologous end joining protein Ku